MFRPYAHARYEIFFMRLLFACFVFVSISFMLPRLIKVDHVSKVPENWTKMFVGVKGDQSPIERLDKIPTPVGLAHFCPSLITKLTDHHVASAAAYLLFVCLVLYVFGIALPITLGIAALIHTCVFTLNNSQGATHHGYQIITIALIAQWIATMLPWIWRLFGKQFQIPKGLRLWDLEVYYTHIGIAGCYVIAAVTKLLASGPMWVIKAPMVAVQIHKTHDQKYYEYLDRVWFEDGIKYANFAIDNPNLTRLILGGGLFMELIAFALLINRFWAMVIGVSLWIMHVMIAKTMALHFPTNEMVDLIFLANIPFWFTYFILRKRDDIHQLRIKP
jgi:hypothetical protein